ncbi:MAG: SurA N-terminal domain-containing protein [Ectothiorhodospiraceae bacterium]|nr:SurA N-terminal domain-containing protein [Ectothiorhodospiraceae bacterium]
MLLAIREHVRGWLAWIIIILIGAAFALVGLSSYMGPSGGGQVVAEVNGADITRDQLDRAFSQRRTMYEQMYQGELPRSLQDQLRRDALDELITEHLVREFVSTRGFRLSDQDLGALIRADQRFHVDGRFSPEQYRRMLSQQGFSTDRFEQMMRQQALMEQLSELFSDTALVTDRDLERAVALRHQERDLRFARISYQAYVDEVEVTDDEISEFYEQNRDEFQSTERVRVEYVMLERDALIEQLEISDQDIEERFERVRGRFVEEESRTARHILIRAPEGAEEERAQAREQVQELRQRIEDGESFGDLAREYSDDTGSAREGGSLGRVERGLMVEPFEDALFALEDEGAMSEPVETRFGVHLIQLDRIHGGDEVSLEDVRDEVRQELAEERVERELFDRRSRLEEMAFDWADSLEPAAEELGLEIRESDWFSRQGGEGIASEEAVVRAAFGGEVLEAQQNSDVLELEGGRFVVIRIADHEPRETLALDEVRDDIEQHLRSRKAFDLARERADNVLAGLRDGGDFSELAGDAPEMELEEAGFVKRDASYPRPLLREAFRLGKPGEDEAVYGVVDLGDGSLAVLQVNAVRDGNLEELDDEAVAGERRRLRELATEASIQDFLSQLRQDADVRIHEERFL